MALLKQFHAFFPLLLVIIFIENSTYYILKILYGHFVSKTAKIDKSCCYSSFTEVAVAVLLQNVGVFGIVFISLFFCYIQVAMFLGETGVEQNVIDNFLIEKVRTIFGLLLLMVKIFF